MIALHKKTLIGFILLPVLYTLQLYPMTQKSVDTHKKSYTWQELSGKIVIGTGMDLFALQKLLLEKIPFHEPLCYEIHVPAKLNPQQGYLLYQPGKSLQPSDPQYSSHKFATSKDLVKQYK